MKIRCGTRGSVLALNQTQLVIDALTSRHPQLEVERHEVKTLGDRKQGTPAASFSDKKDWVYDLELALLDNAIDFAVHSSKDVPYELEPGTALLPVLPRGNPFDAFVGRINRATGERLKFVDLPQGAKVGTASLRRRAFLLQLRPDLQVIEHRGNMTTRLQKMDDSDDIMGIILASAGLERLQLSDLVFETFSAEEMLPALNQATLAVQFRAEDHAMRDKLQAIVDPATLATWQAERTIAEILQGDCKSAIAVYAQCVEDKLFLQAKVMLPDGSASVSAEDSATLDDAVDLGECVGNRLLALGAQKIIEQSRG